MSPSLSPPPPPPSSTSSSSSSLSSLTTTNNRLMRLVCHMMAFDGALQMVISYCCHNKDMISFEIKIQQKIKHGEANHPFIPLYIDSNILAPDRELDVGFLFFVFGMRFNYTVAEFSHLIDISISIGRMNKCPINDVLQLSNYILIRIYWLLYWRSTHPFVRPCVHIILSNDTGNFCSYRQIYYIPFNSIPIWMPIDLRFAIFSHSYRQLALNAF